MNTYPLVEFAKVKSGSIKNYFPVLTSTFALLKILSANFLTIC